MNDEGLQRVSITPETRQSVKLMVRLTGDRLARFRPLRSKGYADTVVTLCHGFPRS